MICELKQCHGRRSMTVKMIYMRTTRATCRKIFPRQFSLINNKKSAGKPRQQRNSGKAAEHGKFVFGEKVYIYTVHSMMVGNNSNNWQC
jgi:hypothetical protein